MMDYEYLFATTLQQKLKTKIIGRIFVKVTLDDQLFIKIEHEDGLYYKMFIDDFSNRIRNGWSTDYAVYEVVNKYRKFVTEYAMTKYFYND